jgi:hypothetical protein
LAKLIQSSYQSSPPPEIATPDINGPVAEAGMETERQAALERNGQLDAILEKLFASLPIAVAFQIHRESVAAAESLPNSFLLQSSEAGFKI